MDESNWSQFGVDAGGEQVRTSRKTTGWVEDSFIFDEQTGRQTAMPSTKRHIGTSITARRMFWVVCSFSFVFFLLALRAGYLQLYKGGTYRFMAEGNRERVIPIPAERGTIFDRNNIPLTKNIPSFALALIPQNLPRDPVVHEQVVRRLAELTTQSPSDIRDTLKKYGNYSFESIIIKDNLDYDTALSIEIASADLPGVYIYRGSKRLYLHDALNATTTPIMASSTSSTTFLSLSHVLGYGGKLSPDELDALYKKGYLPSDTIGKSGVEKTYETLLRGTFGKRRIEVNAVGREQSVIAEEAPIPGMQIKLSLDLELQQALEKSVQEALIKNNKKRAAAIALDPRTGEVLAMVSLPAFDNNDFSGGIRSDVYKKYIEDTDQPLFNRTIAGTYPSGSTIKPAVASAALQEKIITENTTFLSNGGLHVGKWFFPDWQAGGHGMTDVRKSLAQSVNTFYYYIGGGYGDFVGLGVDKIMAYLSKFHFGEKLGIDLGGEQDGFLPSKTWKEKQTNDRWYIGDTYNVSIGQGDILVTPLQIATMTATVANGGTIYQPHVVHEEVNPTTGTSTEISPVVLRDQVIDPKYLAIVRAGMRDCATSGSCRRLNLLSFEAAGKTGTAQWNSNKANHAWFTSFAPYKEPQIVVTVLVEEGEEGSRIAAPIAYEFYKWWGEHRLVK